MQMVTNVPKSIPISLRISEESAAFISQLEIKDAVTPSEKIRAIIRNAREREEEGNAPERLMADWHDHLQDLQHRVGAAERELKIHSEFVRFALDWQNQFAHEITQDAFNGEASMADLADFENRLADQAFRLIDYIARLGVTTSAPCYNPALVREKLKKNMDLLHLVETQVSKGDE